MGAYVQSAHNDAQASGTSLGVALGNTTTGNLIHIEVGWGSTDVTPTVSSPGNTAVECSTHVFDTTNQQGMAHYYAKNITGETTPTWTVQFGSSVPDRHITVSEHSGLDTTAPLDKATGQTVASPGTGTDGATSGNMANTTNASDWLIASYQDIDGAGPSLTAGTSYTSRNFWLAGNGQRIGIETRQVSSTGAYAGTFTLGTNARSIVMVAAFKDSGGGAATRPVKMASYWGGYAGESGGFAG